jgi:nucleotide-binding universal stress UspA family protein
MQKILCPIDFSHPAEAALAAAADAAREKRASLTLVHVLDYEKFALAEGYPGLRPDVTQAVRASAAAALDNARAFAAERGANAVEVRLLEGTPWDAITRLARDEGFSLIVLSTHGRTGLAHALIGSVAERVLRHASCSVLVVR